MNVNNDCYELVPAVLSENILRFYFMSTGITEIIKIVQYQLVGTLNEKPLYNLGFGDWDIINETLNDSIASQNGDQYKVLNTVLSTIPVFFEKYSDATLLVQGSDSLPSFIENCRISCKKKCTGECKNAHRRIKIYKGYIDKNFNFLKTQYHFFGSKPDEMEVLNPINDYYINNDFSMIFVQHFLDL